MAMLNGKFFLLQSKKKPVKTTGRQIHFKETHLFLQQCFLHNSRYLP